MKNLKLLLSTALIASLMLTGCASKEAEEVSPEVTSVEASVDTTTDEQADSTSETLSAGYMDGNKFVNEYLGFSAEIPEAWEIQGKETLDKMNKAGSEVASNGDKELEDSMDNAINENMLFQVSAFKFPLESTTTANPNVSLIAEKIKIDGVLYSLEDYTTNLQTMLSNIEIVTSALIGDDITIDGTVFKTMEAKMNFNDIEVSQKYFITTSKDYAVTISLAYYDDESLNELMQVVDSIKMTK